MEKERERAIRVKKTLTILTAMMLTLVLSSCISGTDRSVGADSFSNVAALRVEIFGSDPVCAKLAAIQAAKLAAADLPGGASMIEADMAVTLVPIADIARDVAEELNNNNGSALETKYTALLNTVVVDNNNNSLPGVGETTADRLASLNSNDNNYMDNVATLLDPLTLGSFVGLF